MELTSVSVVDVKLNDATLVNAPPKLPEEVNFFRNY